MEEYLRICYKTIQAALDFSSCLKKLLYHAITMPDCRIERLNTKITFLMPLVGRQVSLVRIFIWVYNIRTHTPLDFIFCLKTSRL